MFVVDRPFMAILPKPPEIGDEVIIKGKLKDDANIFSVNFCLETNPNPTYIAYHFKTIFETNIVVQNFKTAGEWSEEIIEENTWYNVPGSKFTLTFHIGEDDYFVYTGDEGRNFQYQFPHQLNIKDIECVQLWDDIEYVNEIIFRYKQK